MQCLCANFFNLCSTATIADSFVPGKAVTLKLILNGSYKLDLFLNIEVLVLN